MVLALLATKVDEGLQALVFAMAAIGPSLAALTMWLPERIVGRPVAGAENRCRA